MRKLIPLFLSLIIFAPAFAVVTNDECASMSRDKCGEEPGCGWEKSSGVLGSRSCKACQKDEYSERVISEDNNALECKQCSGITQYTNPDTGEVITYGANYYKETLGAGRTITDCYANCQTMANDLSSGDTGRWKSVGSNTAYYPEKCQFACYQEHDLNSRLNICNSYYDKSGKNEICTPTWVIVEGAENIEAKKADLLPNPTDYDACDDAKRAIFYAFTGDTRNVCSALECTDDTHMVDVTGEVMRQGITISQYYCKIAGGDTITNMYQACEPNIISCAVLLGQTTCDVEIDGVEKTGTVGGNAVWNGINAYKTDQCTCTISDVSTTTGRYDLVCKLSTTSNTWDGNSCETTITTCNSGYCIVGYDANNKHQTCDTAPKGYYSDGRGVLECNKCPAGKTTASTGRTSVGECTYSTSTTFCDSVGCFNLNYSSLGN
ncbi:MAG: hypothetical protein Q4E56_03685 [Pseudomonadota bacterium]|nr:hypothetical protein [Pseudomonadota bacterium]